VSLGSGSSALFVLVSGYVC